MVLAEEFVRKLMRSQLRMVSPPATNFCIPDGARNQKSLDISSRPEAERESGEVAN